MGKGSPVRFIDLVTTKKLTVLGSATFSGAVTYAGGITYNGSTTFNGTLRANSDTFLGNQVTDVHTIQGIMVLNGIPVVVAAGGTTIWNWVNNSTLAGAQLPTGIPLALGDLVNGAYPAMFHFNATDNRLDLTLNGTTTSLLARTNAANTFSALQTLAAGGKLNDAQRLIFGNGTDAFFHFNATNNRLDLTLNGTTTSLLARTNVANTWSALQTLAAGLKLNDAQKLILGNGTDVTFHWNATDSRADVVGRLALQDVVLRPGGSDAGFLSLNSSSTLPVVAGLRPLVGGDIATGIVLSSPARDMVAFEDFVAGTRPENIQTEINSGGSISYFTTDGGKATLTAGGGVSSNVDTIVFMVAGGNLDMANGLEFEVKLSNSTPPVTNVIYNISVNGGLSITNPPSLGFGFYAANAGNWILYDKVSSGLAADEVDTGVAPAINQVLRCIAVQNGAQVDLRGYIDGAHVATISDVNGTSSGTALLYAGLRATTTSARTYSVDYLYASTPRPGAAALVGNKPPIPLPF